MGVNIYTGGGSHQCPHCGATNPYYNDRCNECGGQLALRGTEDAAYDPLRDDVQKPKTRRRAAKERYWSQSMSGSDPFAGEKLLAKMDSTGRKPRALPAHPQLPKSQSVTPAAYDLTPAAPPAPTVAAAPAAPATKKSRSRSYANYCPHCARCHDHVHENGGECTHDHPVRWVNVASFFIPVFGLYSSLADRERYPVRAAGAAQNALLGLMLFCAIFVGRCTYEAHAHDGAMHANSYWPTFQAFASRMISHVSSGASNASMSGAHEQAAKSCADAGHCAHCASHGKGHCAMCKSHNYKHCGPKCSTGHCMCKPDSHTT